MRLRRRFASSFWAGDLVRLGSGRWRQPDKNYDAITAWISTERIGVEIGFPIVNEPNVASLIDVDLGATHGWDEAWRRWRRTV